MITDLDRLHRVVSGELTGPRVGNTFARCHIIAGALEVGEEMTVVAIIPKWSHYHYIRSLLQDVLSDHEIEVTREFHNRHRLELYVPGVNGVRYLQFLARDRSPEHQLQGLRCSIVDIQ